MVRFGIVSDVPIPETYHKGRTSRPDGIASKDKWFLAWDGEGITFNPGKPQSYVLFGCSTGENLMSTSLKTHEICEFIVEIGRKYPDAIHVGFSFNYDSNMIVRSLLPRNLEYLHKNGFVTIGANGGRKYCIQLRKSKWFSVTEYAANYDRKTNPNAKTTVRIFDLFGFFTTSFIKAYENMIGPVPEEIVSGKASRSMFEWEERDTMKRYWEIETRMIAELAEELRRRLYAADLRITSWHGPGALASYAMRQNNMKQHKAESPQEVKDAARYGYMGGRFELYKVGRVKGPIYSLDINSAYPYAISQLPSLSEGNWVHKDRPNKVARFGIYHVRMLTPRSGIVKPPSPIFHRDARGNISFPWSVEGWYWSPEVHRLIGNPNVEIIEGWEYLGSQSLPFSWVADMYAERKRRKAVGDSSEYALKLCMNSLYGKMAQRVGYDEKTGRIPPWHQLEWAGWVTSYTRSMLYRLMSQIRWQDIVAVETDGIYTLSYPSTYQNSKELGGWEITEIEELLYVQSGLAWLKQDGKWKPKRRGLDPGTWTLDRVQDYVKRLEPNQKWEPFAGEQTRFITLGSALMSSAPVKVRHCLWEKSERLIAPGEIGKRIHIPAMCRACRAGQNAWDAQHELVIRTQFRDCETGQVDIMSHPHDIPWENGTEHSAEWRDWDTTYNG